MYDVCFKKSHLFFSSYSENMPKRRKSDEDAGKTKLSKNNTLADVSNKDDNCANNSSAIPIFLKKTYRMIETCDSDICSWTTDGEMFVVKNPVGIDSFPAEFYPACTNRSYSSNDARNCSHPR